MRLAAPRLEPKAVSRFDWHNARAEILFTLQGKREAVAADADADAARKAILRDLKARF